MHVHLVLGKSERIAFFVADHVYTLHFVWIFTNQIDQASMNLTYTQLYYVWFNSESPVLLVCRECELQSILGVVSNTYHMISSVTRKPVAVEFECHSNSSDNRTWLQLYLDFQSHPRLYHDYAHKWLSKHAIPPSRVWVSVESQSFSLQLSWRFLGVINRDPSVSKS